MDNLIILILGLGLGGAIVFFFLKKKKSTVVKQEAQVLLESTKRICKLATVEGEFSEIFQHSNKESYFFDLFTSEKKALVIIKARALLGFDLSKMLLEANENNRSLSIKQFPEPEIISLDTDCQYYDVSNGTFNKFSPNDLTQIQKEAKQVIKQKIENGHLPKMALEQAGEALSLVQHTASKLGWQVNNLTQLQIPVLETNLKLLSK
ncbi:MAG: DUF4230 domain-containing protein [Ferruginibacter sp.]|nr:DUF4230 domain-containing protein [Ferruginibacter sp.]